ncbi:MAG: cyclic nucleotide-binding protein [Myxococcales bacterium]|nr:cyclic nucleotide-binding protein [Myxococcales bacterium]
MSSKNPTKVLILGGGYVAIYAVKALKRAIRRGEVDVTVVDKNNYHCFHGLVPEMLVGKIQAGQIISPARRIFQPARFVLADIEKVDTQTKSVAVRRGHDGEIVHLAYDHLIVGLGSVDNLTRYRGIGEHTLRLKSYWDIIGVRNRVLAMLEMAELEDDPEERKRLLHFVIAGGNYAGVEVAAELAAFLNGLAKKEFRRLQGDEVRVTLVHAGDHVLPELGERFPKLSAKAAHYLQSIGVHLKLGLRLDAATPLEAILSDGSRLPSRTIISCTGTAQSPVLATLPFDRDAHGRLVADANGCVNVEAQIWTGGDCGAIPMKKGGTAPPLALYAMQAGKTIGKNILRSLRGKPLKPYSFGGLGDCCQLSTGKGVGQMMGIPVTGWLCWLIWRAFMVAYLPSWMKRVRTVLDWMTTPFLGRDIIAVTAPSEMGVQQQLFEPGQFIVNEGDVGKAMFLIRSGEVEVIRRGEDGTETAIATLGPGEHFGEIAVLNNVRRTASVRARSAVELLRIGQEQANLLTSTYQGFGEIAATAESRLN